MFLWLLFIVASFVLGLSVSFLLDYPFRSIERGLFSFVVGHALSIWIVFLIVGLTTSLSIACILLSIGICTLIAILTLSVTKRSGKWDLNDVKRTIVERWYEDSYTLPFLIAILLYVSFMNLYGVFRPDDAGSLYAFHTVWADYPWHTSLITSMVYSDTFSFPLANPQFLNHETHYPFLMDFLSAVLMESGLDLRSSIIIPNMLFQLAFFGLFYFLAYRLTDRKGAGMVATFMLILAGFPAGLQAVGIHFLNPMYAVLMPQRTALFGMAISFVVYLLLFHALCAEKQETTAILRRTYKELILAGVLIGLLPYIHAHSFMATGFVALFLALFTVIKNPFKKSVSGKILSREAVMIFVLLFVPLMLLSLPQILFIRTGVSQDFFVFFPGWTSENMAMILGFDWSSLASALLSIAKTATIIETFWAINVGGLLILLSFGFFKARTETRFFYLPFLLLFFLANIVKFQPWYFDNYKLFLHWLALSAILAALAICWIYEVHEANNSPHKKLTALSIAALLIGSTVFGVVTHVNMVQHTYVVWSGEEIELAEWVRANTASDAVFLTGTAHNHPIPSLSGRQRVMGYEGWLWSQGLNGSKVVEAKRDVIEIYKGNDTLMQDYGVDYVSVGPYERAFARENNFEINNAAFNDKTRFYLKYDEMVGGERWRIYEVS